MWTGISRTGDTGVKDRGQKPVSVGVQGREKDLGVLETSPGSTEEEGSHLYPLTVL